MIKLTQLLKEIKINRPQDVLQNYFFKTAYDFFKNDQDIFKNSGIENILMKNRYNIVNLVWDSYNEIYRGYEIEDEDYDQNSIPSSKQDVLNPNKQTGGLEDTWYHEVNEFLLPYIVDHLKKTGWEPAGEFFTEVKKDNITVDIFDYMEYVTDYDTDPRERLYEEFTDYFEENF